MRERNLPAAPESELTVLGCMLNDEDDLANGVTELHGSDFTVEAHVELFNALTDLHYRGDPLTPPALLDALGPASSARELIGDLMEVPIGISMGKYMGIVKDRASRRALHAAAVKIARDVTAEQLIPLPDLLDGAERAVLEIGNGMSGDDVKFAKDLVLPALRRMQDGGVKGLPTGYRRLDAKLAGRGLLPGQLVVVAGGTSMGKSIVGLQMALNCALTEKKQAVMFTLEMTEDNMMDRALATESLTDLGLMLEGELAPADLERLQTAMMLLKSAPLAFDARAHTVGQMLAKCRRLKRDGGLGLVVVDYLQLMTGKGENRTQQVGSISRGLKRMAKDLDCPVVALSQLSREAAKRTDHRPQLSDLRESGDIEQDADTVILVYRPEYFHGPTMQVGRGNKAESIDVEGKVELIIAKQRNGATGMAELFFRKHCVRFEDPPASLSRYA